MIDWLIVSDLEIASGRSNRKQSKNAISWFFWGPESGKLQQYLPLPHFRNTWNIGIPIITTMMALKTHMRKRGPAIIIGWRNLFVRRRPALNLITDHKKTFVFCDGTFALNLIIRWHLWSDNGGGGNIEDNFETVVKVTLTPSTYPPRSLLVLCRPSMEIVIMGLVHV